MQKLFSQEVDVPTYHFMFHKTLCVSYFKFMFHVHYIQKNGIIHFHYCVSWKYLSNGLSSDPNVYRMQKLCP